MDLVIVHEHRRELVEIFHVRLPELGRVAASIPLAAEAFDVQAGRDAVLERTPRAHDAFVPVDVGAQALPYPFRIERRRGRGNRRSGRGAGRRGRCAASIVCEADRGRDIGGAR